MSRTKNIHGFVNITNPYDLASLDVPTGAIIKFHVASLGMVTRVWQNLSEFRVEVFMDQCVEVYLMRSKDIYILKGGPLHIVQQDINCKSNKFIVSQDLSTINN